VKKRLQIQLHCERLPGPREPAPETRAQGLLDELVARAAADVVSRETGLDEGVAYANALLATDDLSAVWSSVAAQLRSLGLERAAIVVCEGEQGWDDYLLLHHHDPAEPVDRLG
jgi:hypothetical protein